MNTRPGLTHRRAIIVGAGQSGLAVAAALASKGMTPQRDFIVIDASDGDRSWASRWHSLTLLSDARHSALPLFPFPGDQRRHPRADEVIDYLATVEAGIGVQPVWGIRVSGLDRPGDGTTLRLATTAGEIQTRNVVCATGAAARLRLPVWAGDLAVPGRVLYSSQYLFPRQIPQGDVLIVGGGNAGVQLARELSASHAVTLSVRTPRRHRPVAGFPTLAGEGATLLRRKRRLEPLFTDTYLRLQRDGVCVVPAVAGVDGKTVALTDGTILAPTSVILATGYLPGDDWLPAAIRDTPAPRTKTALPGLFVAGIPRYSRRGADTLHGVWRDAAAIAHHIINRP